MTRGAAAEQRVLARLTAALPAPFRIYPNVSWTAPSRPGAAATDGEADLVIAHPELGILVIEVKSGEPTRDAAGRWWLGPNKLDRSPFEQAKANKYELAKKIASMPGWSHAQGPIAGHAVAFPSVDLAAAGHARPSMGEDAPPQIILDATALESDVASRAWVEGAFSYWNGDGATRGHAPGAGGMAVIEALLAPTMTLTRRLSRTLREDRDELLHLSTEQMRVLVMARGLRRVEVVGPAGSGKSMLAAERARRLAAEGYRTLLVCYNQRLATSMSRELADETASAGLTVTTFHTLCERMARQADVLPARPSPIPQDWWDTTLPHALESAMSLLPDERYHAIVVDEGQDFAADWLQTLDLLLHAPGEDVLWVFHDPGQALYRDDVVAASGLGLEPLELLENRRNPIPVAELASRFYMGEGTPFAMRDSGLRPRIIEAAAGAETLEALRKELHRLVIEEGVRTWDICVLSGVSAPDSDVWRQRRFGSVILGNAALAEDGRHIGLPPELIDDDPSDTVLFETIRRFKGLEAPVIVLVELPDEEHARGRLDALLYVALTRATSSLTVIATPALAARLR
jgi:hypothetical protein